MSPVRTCVACRKREENTRLLRWVAGASGPVPDEAGRAPGRGAYLCLDEACLDKVLSVRNRKGPDLRGAEMVFRLAIRARLGENVRRKAEKHGETGEAPGTCDESPDAGRGLPGDAGRSAPR